MAAVPPGLILLVLGAVLFFVIYFIARKERFVPVKPSKYQDKRYVTPAGNTIVY